MSDIPLLEGTVMPPSGGQQGEYLQAKGPGNLDDAHAPETSATALLGKDPEMEELTPEWVITRLMREASDYGKRSRQTARVGALGMLAKMQGLMDEGGLGSQKETPLQRALAMPKAERDAMIRKRLRELGMLPDE